MLKLGQHRHMIKGQACVMTVMNNRFGIPGFVLINVSWFREDPAPGI
jgi:hypothetical protein